MKIKTLINGLILASAISITTADACTRVLRADHEPAVMVGRNMDWYSAVRLPANLWVYPRGMERNGGVSENPLRWRAKYGSIVATVYDDLSPIATDGMNEHGLAAHVNSLQSSDYGVRNPDVPAVSLTMWVQYYLDNFKTVDEAVRYTASNAFQVTGFSDPKSGRKMGLHLGIEDATGDSAIIEYTDGVMHIYHDRAYTVMTNDPPYSKQLDNLKLYQGFGGSKPLPGTIDPRDRFVRATFYAEHLPEYKTARDEVTGMFTVLHNATQPAGTQSSENPHVGETVWRVVSDLTNHTYYFSSMKSLNLIYASLDKFDLKEGAKPMRLVVQERQDLSGDVTGLFLQM